jgi:hypothetical protein
MLRRRHEQNICVGKTRVFPYSALRNGRITAFINIREFWENVILAAVKPILSAAPWRARLSTSVTVWSNNNLRWSIELETRTIKW